MTKENKKKTISSLILPLGLLLVEVIAVIVLQRTGYKISGFLTAFLIILAVILIFQVIRQLWVAQQTKMAFSRLESAEKMVEAGKPMEAIQLWKIILLTLPREQYLNVLTKLAATYETQDMTKGAQQARLIHSESIKLFTTATAAKNATPEDKRKWQAKVYELQKMIRALPVEKEQDPSNITPEE